MYSWIFFWSSITIFCVLTVDFSSLTFVITYKFTFIPLLSLCFLFSLTFLFILLSFVLFELLPYPVFCPLGEEITYFVTLLLVVVPSCPVLFAETIPISSEEILLSCSQQVHACVTAAVFTPSSTLSFSLLVGLPFPAPFLEFRYGHMGSSARKRWRRSTVFKNQLVILLFSSLCHYEFGKIWQDGNVTLGKMTLGPRVFMIKWALFQLAGSGENTAVRCAAPHIPGLLVTVG